MACVKELGGLESTPQTNFVEKAGGVEKTVGGFNPPPTTKSLCTWYNLFGISLFTDLTGTDRIPANPTRVQYQR